MILKLSLSGRIPAKKNNKQIRINFRTGKRFIASSDKHHDWHDQASIQIKAQLLDIKAFHQLPIQLCKRVHLVLYYGDNYVKDNTNTADSIHDLIVDCGVIVDDKWQVTGETSQRPIFRKGNHGADIVIEY